MHRIDPSDTLGLEVGDAHVIRNAGGRATDDAVRSLLISSWLLGTREFLVIHHTDCGMAKFTDDVLVGMVRNATGEDLSEREFHTFSDVGPERPRRRRRDPGGARSSGRCFGVRPR